MFLSAFAPPREARSAAVEAQLVIPPAETRVIGDPIPLIWRFSNTGSEPLGFMWEGCCRLNGRLSVTLDGRDVEPIPPGQALAHMFAKAERLEPGKPRDFDTRLSDWVRLERGGTYELRGRYTGVLPSQQPQVPRGLALWRDASETPPAHLAVIDVAEYLSQREARSRKRSITLELSGPERLPPLEPAPLKLRIRNTGAQAIHLQWPHPFDLWIVDGRGRRLSGVNTAVGGNYEEITIPAGDSVDRDIAFNSERMEGQPFGDYRVFVDLAPGREGQPRAPSSAFAMRWELGSSDVRQLVEKASSGSAAGLRNPALKLLRVHLGEIGSALESLANAALPDKAAQLAKELALAACLKPFSPAPGAVQLPLRIGRDGKWRFADAQLVRCATKAGSTPADQLAAIVGVRRHLGWQPGVELQPDETATAAALFQAVESLAPVRAELAAPPQWVVRHPDAQVSCRVVPRTDLAGEPPSMVVTRVEGRLRFFLPAEAADRAPQLLDSVAALEREVARQPRLFARPLLEAPGELTVRELRTVLEPFARRGAQVDLVLAD